MAEDSPQSADDLPADVGIVTEEIKADKCGRVAWGPSSFKARSEDNTYIPASALVNVISREGSRLTVKKLTFGNSAEEEAIAYDYFPIGSASNPLEDSRREIVQGISTTLKEMGHNVLPEKPSRVELTVTIEDKADEDEVAREIANLCKALNAYHIACGGNGLTIDEWEMLINAQVPVGV